MTLNKIFASHMVLPAGKNLRFYGEGTGTVSISFAGVVKTQSFTEDSWCIEFPPMEYGGPYEINISLDGEEVVLEDVYVGEVYLFSGQSNLQYKTQESSFIPGPYPDDNKLRLFSTERLEKGPYDDFFFPDDGWKVSKSDEVGRWSAIGYLSGLQICREKNIAVGVIACYQGASVIESWVPAGYFDKYNVPADKKHVDHTVEYFSTWNKEGTLYNFALGQVKPFALTGVIWYQGESDTTPEEASVYGNQLADLIALWRKDFNDPELPFVVVQIADYEPRSDEGWKMVQEAQWDIQFKVPNVKTVISKDVCETNDIHPPTKHKLAERIADALMKI